MNIKRIFAASVLSGMMMLGASAHAATVDFIFSGVILNCPDTGFLPCGTTVNTGDDVDGVLTVDMAAVMPNGAITTSDIAGYDFNLGGPLMLDDGNSTAVSSSLLLDASSEVFAGSLVLNSPGLFGGMDVTDVTLNFGSNFWFATVTVNNETIEIANGVGKIALVPVPGALLMFAPALLGFLGLRRKAA